MKTLIIGGGLTGQSIERFLRSQGRDYEMWDTRDSEQPQRAVSDYAQVVLSPGVSIHHPWVEQAQSEGVAVTGDIQIFFDAVKAPVIAITGTNGKSTVTTMVAHILEKSGFNVACGGNLGTPALDLLNENIDVYVVEVSSFQLETVTNVRPKAATILNLTDDHLDRHGSMEQYLQEKLKLVLHAECVVLNQSLKSQVKLSQDLHWVAENGSVKAFNEAVAIQLCVSMDVKASECEEALASYQGLRHRNEVVTVRDDITWSNDSKGTNIGAMMAAVQSSPSPLNQTIALLGGVSKGADFSVSTELLQSVQEVIVYGKDRELIQQQLGETVRLNSVETLFEACEQAKQKAQFGSTVLFSPACASFDQFANFEARGEAFVDWVKTHVEGKSQ